MSRRKKRWNTLYRHLDFFPYSLHIVIKIRLNIGLPTEYRLHHHTCTQSPGRPFESRDLNGWYSWPFRIWCLYCKVNYFYWDWKYAIKNIPIFIGIIRIETILSQRRYRITSWHHNAKILKLLESSAPRDFLQSRIKTLRFPNRFPGYCRDYITGGWQGCEGGQGRINEFVYQNVRGAY